MPDSTRIRIETAESRSLVSLKVSRTDADEARERLGLALPLRSAGEHPQSLWLGPDHWLLVGSRQPASALVEECDAQLAGLVFNAVDQSAACAVLRVEGLDAREVLASGASLDFCEGRFPQGDCRPTRLAQIAAVVLATGPDAFELFIDRGYEKYLCDWLADTARIVNHASRERS